jgi:glucose/arabinose dehydrogenase
VIGADGQVVAEPFAHVESGGVFQLGLSGLALDPDFATNHYVYAFYLEKTGSEPQPVGRPVLVRFTEVDNKGTDQTVILDDLPETDPEHPFGVNGSIHFGPDGFLYVTLGDYNLSLAQDGKEYRIGPNGKELPQDLTTPIGKILRINKEDGSAPPDNRWWDRRASMSASLPTVSRPFDFTFHPETGALIGSDSSGVTCEELNIVSAGSQYGWPNGTFLTRTALFESKCPRSTFTFEGIPAEVWL